VGIFRRRREQQRPVDTEEDPEVGGDRMVFWKAKSELVDDEIYGPVWIANLEGEIIQDPELWLTWEEAEEFARRRELPLEDV
jgi:hypothetical protein